MNRRIQTPRGTSDVLGDAALAREELERTAKGILERSGYSRIETPVFEATELVPVPIAPILRLDLQAQPAPLGSARWIIVNAQAADGVPIT